MTSLMKATRRTVLAGTAAAAAAPALSLVPAAASTGGQSRIARLWAEAEAIKAQMAVHAREIAAMSELTGLAGWMRLGGAANELGNRRYQALIAMIRATPASLDDLALIARATKEDDIRFNGPAAWSHGEFDRAARAYHMSA